LRNTVRWEGLSRRIAKLSVWRPVASIDYEAYIDGKSSVSIADFFGFSMLRQSARLETLLLQQLESLSRSGVGQLRRQSKTPPNPTDKGPAPQLPRPKEMTTPIKRTEKAEESSPAAQLAVLQKEVAECRRCRELANTRTQTVFGVGNIRPRLCFMGEAPGADEDRQGFPFVGRAGKLLTDMIERGMGLTRDDVYILNVLKCRPPDNRTPNSDEVANCREYFERQIAALQPEFICCLGTVAAQSLLETTTPVGKLRGRIHNYRGSKVIVTYHPSYLLRSPDMKKEAWIDLQLLLKEMGMPIPQRQQGTSS
jgi:uracil-DNA glycosylase